MYRTASRQSRIPVEAAQEASLANQAVVADESEPAAKSKK
uniref:Uncharacterized protein n=1 Tax=Siphoviridae sp. ctr4Z12 TaxID=2827280 RepID=A0A8S5R4S7_9CAUD|nr:MAG TPA: hypothetical protein [Siphoviridae sp. ctr4Z12]DAI79504.1 MAG TPA: hypothetical protein [Caudoviricetes sp.]